MAQSENIHHLRGLAHLRAFAALVVILYHGMSAISGVPTAPAAPLWNVIREGHAGVSLFLVLSGFLFEYGTRGRSIRYWPFLRNRFLRIYPLFLFMVFVEAYAEPTKFTFVGFLQTIFLMGNLPGANVMVGNQFIGATWTLMVEFQFYLLFPFLHRMFHRHGMRWMTAVLGLLLLTRLLMVYGDGTNARDLSYWTIFGRLDQFLTGMIAARFYAQREGRSRVPLAAFFPLTLVVIVAAATWFHRAGGWDSESNWKVVWMDGEALICAAFIVTYLPLARFLPALLEAGLDMLGELSYSTYLLHYTLVSIFLAHNWYPKLSHDPNWNGLLGTLVTVFPLTLAIAALTYTLIEKPFLALRGKYLGPSFSDANPAAEDRVVSPVRPPAEDSAVERMAQPR